MEFLTNPFIISILGSLIAVLLIYMEAQMSNKGSILENKDYIKYFIIISLILYASIYLLNNKTILQVGSGRMSINSKEIFVGTPDF